MQSDRCKALTAHISRIQGQLETLKSYIDDGKTCQDVAQLSVSAIKSFDSLKAKILEAYIAEYANGKGTNQKEFEKNMQQMLAIVKA